MLLLTLHKALVAMEHLLPRAIWLPVLLLVVLVGAGGERRIVLAVAANPRGVVVFSAFLRVSPAVCTGIRVQLDHISTCVRILYYLFLNEYICTLIKKKTRPTYIT